MSAAVTAPDRPERPAPDRPRRFPLARVRPATAWFFLILVAYQGFHQIEHTIETVQLKLLGHHESHTLLRGIDFEWLHFGVNTVLLYGLAAVVIAAGPAVRERWRSERPRGWTFMVAALVVQGYHVVDHSVRLVEHVLSGGDRDPQGTLTRVVDPVWFHFSMNLAVFATMAIAFLGLGMHHSLRAPRGAADLPAGS